MFADPETVFQGTLVFVAPHMDDEVLACGGTIARLPDKERIHIAYATDGARSPVPAFAWMGTASAELPDVRRAEAAAALKVLGVPPQNAAFLDFPDGALLQYLPALRQALAALLDRLRPSHVFIPFRYDRHPDHLALHTAALQALATRPTVQVVEYFVYHRWRLVPGGDVRSLIRPEHLMAVDIQRQSRQKRSALACYESQTTCYFPWQDRPILPPARVDEVSQAPELFLKHDAGYPGAAIFSRLQHWIPFAHRAEPLLKKKKDEVKTLLRYGARRRGR